MGRGKNTKGFSVLGLLLTLIVIAVVALIGVLAYRHVKKASQTGSPGLAQPESEQLLRQVKARVPSDSEVDADTVAGWRKWVRARVFQPRATITQ